MEINPLWDYLVSKRKLVFEAKQNLKYYQDLNCFLFLSVKYSWAPVAHSYNPTQPG
jgi:hypothetical protein